jgi:alpha-L-fucosidase
MKVNGEAIYGTTASPFKNVSWGRCTKKITGKETTLYLHVFDWPQDGRLLVPGLKNKPDSVTLLADGHKLESASTENGLAITLPTTAPDKMSSTVVLNVNGALKIE